MTDQLLRCIGIFSFIEEKNKLGEKPTKQNIEDFVRSNFYQNETDVYTKSSFHRDLEFIKLNFNDSLTSTSNRPTTYYFETFGTTSNFFKDLNRNLVLLAALKEQNKKWVEQKMGKTKLNVLTSKIVFDEKESSGIDYFKQILDACENKQVIDFEYFDYEKQTSSKKRIEPYILKEKKNKWYVLGFDVSKPEIFRSYALERISNFENTKQKFTSKDTDFEKPYENAVGMFTDGKAEKIVLQFDSRDGNYLKSNPIHHSQKVKEIENGVELKLFVKPTLDFIMEIISRSWSLKIVEPEFLRDQVTEIWRKAIKRNS